MHTKYRLSTYAALRHRAAIHMGARQSVEAADRPRPISTPLR